MSLEDYRKAQKMGKKDYQLRLIRGERPVLQTLDDILPTRGEYSEVPLGVVQIPINLIMGTKTEGRSNAFSGNFMPILDEETEFAIKWITLCKIHEKEGIQDPIQAYEYMGYFYVEEGNKRVSVLKYSGAVSVMGHVTRMAPPRTEEKENKIYFEYVDFYEKSKVNYLGFSQLGSFKAMQKLVKGDAQAFWTEDDQLTMNSVYTRFEAEYRQREKDAGHVQIGDAFLAFLKLYGYDKVSQMTASRIQELVGKSWEEFELLKKEKDVDLKLKPIKWEKNKLLSLFLPVSIPHLKIAFVQSKSPATSGWCYNHELGRMHLMRRFPREVQTVTFENVPEDGVDAVLEQAIADGCNLIFTTAPSFASASVKAAIAHPEVYILNCSLNTSHRYIRTYYARTYEAKFLLGAVAGAMAENDRIAYIGDYPIYSTIANINAFALGAKMINPRSEIYLHWSSQKDYDLDKFLWKTRCACISGRDMMLPSDSVRLFGLYHFDGRVSRNLAMPLCHWGKFYEQLIDNIIDGGWKKDEDASEGRAINYWWGMSARVVDILCSKHLPVGTARLIDFLRHTIKHEHFYPFTGALYSQQGVVQSQPGYTLTPEELVEMDWLAENVIGSIPKNADLLEGAKPVVAQQGVRGAEEE